jgi:hypothetical protein
VLGVNPVQHLLEQAHALSTLPAASQQILTGKEFFPALISGPFHQGLIVVFIAAALLSAGAAFASLLRGGRFIPPEPAAAQASAVPAAAQASAVPAAAQAPGAPPSAQEPEVPADGTKNRVLTVRRDEPGRRGT